MAIGMVPHVLMVELILMAFPSMFRVKIVLVMAKDTLSLLPTRNSVSIHPKIQNILEMTLCAYTYR